MLRSGVVHEESSSLPVFTPLINCNDNDNSSFSESMTIRNIENLENEMLNPSASSTIIHVPPISAPTTSSTNICGLYDTAAIDGTFIICSKCNKMVHYLCNNPSVSSYYKKIIPILNTIYAKHQINKQLP